MEGLTMISKEMESRIDKFIEENKSKFLCPDQLKVYYIDYPEDKWKQKKSY